MCSIFQSIPIHNGFTPTVTGLIDFPIDYWLRSIIELSSGKCNCINAVFICWRRRGPLSRGGGGKGCRHPALGLRGILTGVDTGLLGRILTWVCAGVLRRILARGVAARDLGRILTGVGAQVLGRILTRVGARVLGARIPHFANLGHPNLGHPINRY